MPCISLLVDMFSFQNSPAKIVTSLDGGHCDAVCRQVAGLDEAAGPVVPGPVVPGPSVPGVPVHLNGKDTLHQQTIANTGDVGKLEFISPQVLTMVSADAKEIVEAAKATLDDTSDLENLVSGIEDADFDPSELAYLDQDGGIEKSVGNVNLDIFKSVCGGKNLGAQNQNQCADKSDSRTEGDASNPPPLATISISTDKATNMTRILINTGYGQQLFQINTADLTQATTALEPLALQGGMVGFDSNGQILNTGTVNGITVQDGK